MALLVGRSNFLSVQLEHSQNVSVKVKILSTTPRNVATILRVALDGALHRDIAVENDIDERKDGVIDANTAYSPNEGPANAQSFCTQSFIRISSPSITTSAIRADWVVKSRWLSV
ncbi:hypothetical protein MKEN_00078000 [Mycena kentingensis (nom. inval.)]|nr:hypothetical protein MKEN_00078000 [Mycena kentingensis (nom. inval.)]